jgi:uridine kinase
MRIAISGTHCSGKSTLIDEFLIAHQILEGAMLDPRLA